MEKIGSETERFIVCELFNGKYGVIDLTNGQRVGFGYNVPPMYKNEEWDNYYSARGFCQKLAKRNSWHGVTECAIKGHQQRRTTMDPELLTAVIENLESFHQSGVVINSTHTGLSYIVVIYDVPDTEETWVASFDTRDPNQVTLTWNYAAE